MEDVSSSGKMPQGMQLSSSITVEFSIPDSVLSVLMARAWEKLIYLRTFCVPAEIWIAGCDDLTSKVIISGHSKDAVDKARVLMHNFIKNETGNAIASLLPAGEKSTGFQVERYTGSFPVSFHFDDKVQNAVTQARQIIQFKFPETDVNIQSLDSPDSPAGLILVSSTSLLSVEVAKMIICWVFKDQLGIVLEESSPKYLELQYKYERAKENLKKCEIEIANYKDYTEKLRDYKDFWKEKAKKLEESTITNDKEMVQLKNSLKRSRDAHEEVVKEREKLLKKLVDPKPKAKIGNEYVENYGNIKIEMSDKMMPTTCRCPQLMIENNELKEKLVVSEKLFKSKEQEVKFAKPQKNAVVDVIDGHVRDPGGGEYGGGQIQGGQYKVASQNLLYSQSGYPKCSTLPQNQSDTKCHNQKAKKRARSSRRQQQDLPPSLDLPSPEKEVKEPKLSKQNEDSKQQNDDKYQCDKCNVRYKTAGLFRRHVKDKHGCAFEALKLKL